ncbi:MAG: hypothetical protein LBT39_00700 [Treponema sp.]|nr:hypothetical protein [Treponema sp.]
MKRYLLFVILLLPVSVLFAQSRDDVTIYLSPATGGTPEQQAFFNENFRMELIGANYTLVDDQRQADYSMNLNVTQEVEEGYDDVAEEIINVLNISLIDNKDGHEILQFSWAFSTLEDMYEWNLHLIYQAMANVPLTKLTAVPDTNHWRNKWLYLCGYAGLDLYFGFYERENESVSYQGSAYTFYAAPLFTLGLEFQFLNFMSAEIDVSGGPYAIDTDHSTIAFSLPLLLKFPLKPSKHFMLEPYGGVQFNTSSHASIIPPLVSWVGGFQYGIRGGDRGAIIIDIRAIGDIGSTTVNPSVKGNSTVQYDSVNRFQLALMIGFKVGFYNRNKEDEPSNQNSAASTSSAYGGNSGSGDYNYEDDYEY